jgi:aspartyl-tRNA(Asn)/glutamyl-tRNA(Gln) amidotransferase subunit A
LLSLAQWSRDSITQNQFYFLIDFKSPFNASVVNSLEEAGAIMVGKTNMDEFGMG